MIVELQEVLWIKKVLGKSTARFLSLSLVTTRSIIWRLHILSRCEKYLGKVRLLRIVSRVGILIAMEILVELPQVERFRSGDELASYIGLTPSEFSTGQYVRQGRITWE